MAKQPSIVSPNAFAVTIDAMTSDVKQQIIAFSAWHAFCKYKEKH